MFSLSNRNTNNTKSITSNKVLNKDDSKINNIGLIEEQLVPKIL